MQCNGCPLPFEWLLASKEIFWVVVVFTSISEIACINRRRHYENLSVAKGLKMLDLTLSLLLLLKQNIGYKTFFRSSRDVPLSVTFKFWVTLESFRRHDKRQIKQFDFGVGLANFNIYVWKYLIVWKKSTSRQVLHF